MIVKNEEKLLPRCLRSIRDLVDEIIVVDTGSSDKTVEIARDFGAEVHLHLWENDFSKHRNQSISYAKGDWIFIIDADETLFQWDEDIGTLMGNARVDSIRVRVENAYAQGKCNAWHYSMRIFRNNGSIIYRGRIHNEVQGQTNSVFSHVILQHSGYVLSESKEEEKFHRTKNLLIAEIEKNPKDPRNHHYLAVSLLARRLYSHALEEAECALNLASDKKGNVIYLWTRFVAAVSCINLGRAGDAERFCLESIDLNPLHLDSYYILSSTSYSKDSLQMFLECSDRYLSVLGVARENPWRFGDMVLNTVEHEWRILLHRGFAFEKLGHVERAREAYDRARDACPDETEYKRLIKEFQRPISKASLSSKFEESGRGTSLEQFISVEGSFRDGDRHGLEKSSRDGEEPVTGYSNKTEPGISLCMIMKNEEELLPKCLASVRDVVDEIVIVDTGSVDRSVQIGESYGARIFFHPWEGSFSKHRNQSIGYATKEWILILDADEMMEAKSARFIRNVLKESQADSIYLSILSAFDNGKGEAAHNSIRIFKNNGVIHYEGRVHNRIVGERSSLMYPVSVFHSGYNLSPKKSHRKFLRTTELLRREIEESPEDPRGYHYLAASYLSEAMYQEALDYSTRAIDLSERQGRTDHLYLWSHFIAGISNLKLENTKAAEEVCLRALEKNGMHMDSHYLLALIYHSLNQWEKALFHGREYFRLIKEFEIRPGAFGLIVHNTVNHRWRVHAHLGLCLEELNDSEGAEREFSSAERFCSEMSEYHKLMARHYLLKNIPNTAEVHFKRASKGLQSDLELLKIGVDIFNRKGDTAKEKEVLRQLIDQGGDKEEFSFRLGTILLQENSLEEAARFLQDVIEANPRHAGALINLGLVTKRKGKTGEAVSFFKRAIQEEPCSIEGLSNLGYSLYHSGDPVGAKRVFEQLSTIAPELIDPLLVLSRIHVEQGFLEQAVKQCDALLRLLGLDTNVILKRLEDLANLYLEIGRALTKNGQMNEAYWAFETALMLSKNTPNMFERILALYPDSGLSAQPDAS